MNSKEKLSDLHTKHRFELGAMYIFPKYKNMTRDEMIAEIVFGNSNYPTYTSSKYYKFFDAAYEDAASIALVDLNKHFIF